MSEGELQPKTPLSESRLPKSAKKWWAQSLPPWFHAIMVFIFFVGGPLLFNLLVLPGTIRQLLTLRFEQTAGRLLSVRLEPRGQRALPEVSYEYEVNGKTYRGDRYRLFFPYRNHPYQNEADQWTVERIESLKRQSRLTVHYSARSPEIAVLETGLTGREVRLLLGTFMIQAFMLGLARFAFSQALGRKHHGRLVGHPWRRRERGGVVFLGPHPSFRRAFTMAWVAFIPAGFICLLAADFSGAKYGYPSVRAAWLAWAASIGISMLAGMASYLKQSGTQRDFKVDGAGKTLTLPASHRLAKRATVACSAITALHLTPTYGLVLGAPSTQAFFRLSLRTADAVIVLFEGSIGEKEAVNLAAQFSQLTGVPVTRE